MKRKISFLSFLSAVIFCLSIVTTPLIFSAGNWISVSKINSMLGCYCPTTISNSSASDSTITINSAGHYRVSENLNKPIIINSSNVSLDLAWLDITITPTLDSENSEIVTINGDLENITIFNGSISCCATVKGSGSGICINGGTSKVLIEKVKIFNCGNGIKFNGSDGSEVVNCRIGSCDFIENGIGILLNYADETHVENCCAHRCSVGAYNLSNSEKNYITNCQALGTTGSSSLAVFKSDSGANNLFKNCTIEKASTTATGFGSTADGFLLTGTEIKARIVNCFINDVDASGTDATSFGIRLAPTILTGSDLLAVVDSDSTCAAAINSVALSPCRRYVATGDAGNNVRVFYFNETVLAHMDLDNTAAAAINSVSWSPDCRFIATGDAGNNLRIFSFDGSTITHIDADSTPGAIVNTVAWSPNGKYLATGDAGNNLRIFSFNGTTLTHIVADSTAAAAINSVSWSTDGVYLVTGDAGNNVRVFSFNGATLAHVDADSTPAAIIKSVSWSPNGKHIATGDAGNNVRVFTFNGTVLAHIDGDSTAADIVNTVVWSPCGNYIASGDDGTYVRIFSFDGTTLTHEKSDSSATGDILSIAWSSDGKYIIAGDEANDIRAFDAMISPENCLIDGNRICDDQANAQLVSAGIVGGGNNCFIQNVCYNNELNYSYGIPNVFYGSHSEQHPFDNISMPSTH